MSEKHRVRVRHNYAGPEGTASAGSEIALPLEECRRLVKEDWAVEVEGHELPKGQGGGKGKGQPKGQGGGEQQTEGQANAQS